MNRPHRAWFDHALRAHLYPALAVITVAYLCFELSGPPDRIGHRYGLFVGGMVVVMVLIEMCHPLRTNWRMTNATFWRRDLPFLAIGAATIAGANYLAAITATRYSLERGTSHAELPFAVGLVLAVLTTDFLWYWVHRSSHEARGKVGRFLWRVHAAHHLPRQVYVLMHAIGHPINAIVVRAILTLPLFFLGFSPAVVFAASVVTAFQGLVSHFNVDSRVGWLNYVLVGTELHRYHHSAKTEAKNFGAVVSIWDQLFGTFYYRPGEAPEQLGIDDPSHYPKDTQIAEIMTYPFLQRRSPPGS